MLNLHVYMCMCKLYVIDVFIFINHSLCCQQVIFPLTTLDGNIFLRMPDSKLSRMLFKMSKQDHVKVEIFAALVWGNKENKTPLHLAVEYNCLS